jgi:hypothetical protein
MIRYEILNEALEVWVFSHPFQWKQVVLALGYGLAAYMITVSGWAGGVKKRACFFMGVLLALMSLNALFQINEILLYLARAVARDSGQYGARRSLQFDVILIGVAVVLVLLARLRNSLRYLWTDYGAVAVGTMALAGLMLLQSISFHDVDAVLYTRIAGLSVHKLLEAVGVAFTVWGAWRVYRSS